MTDRPEEKARLLLAVPFSPDSRWEAEARTVLDELVGQVVELRARTETAERAFGEQVKRALEGETLVVELREALEYIEPFADQIAEGDFNSVADALWVKQLAKAIRTQARAALTCRACKGRGEVLTHSSGGPSWDACDECAQDEIGQVVEPAALSAAGTEAEEEA